MTRYIVKAWFVLVVCVLIYALATTYAHAHGTPTIDARLFCRHGIAEDSASHPIVTRYRVGTGGVVHVAYRCARTGY